MRTLLFLFAFVVLAYSCSKRTAPAKSEPSVVVTPPPPPPPPDTLAVAATPPPAVGAGKELFLAKCGRCHALKQPENYTAERWTGIMEKMAPKARLTDDEKKNVVAYVHYYAKK